MSDVVVEELRDELEGAYDAFLSSHPAAMLFYDAGHRRLISTFLGCRAPYLVARRGDEVVGVLPVMEIDGPYGRVLNSSPFYGSHGGALAADPAAARALYDRWNERTAEPDVVAATLITNPLESSELAIDAVVHDVRDHRIGGLTPIAERDPAAFIETIAADARYDVRRAVNAGITVAVENDALGWIAEVHAENMATIGGAAKPPRFFELLASTREADVDWAVYVARLDGEPIAGLLNLFAHGIAEYWTPVTVAEHRNAQPSALVLAHAMPDAVVRGCRLWNWGGSWASQAGVLRFKRKWGSVDHPYHYLVRVNDELLRRRPPADVLDGYPYFYVVPFES